MVRRSARLTSALAVAAVVSAGCGSTVQSVSTAGGTGAVVTSGSGLSVPTSGPVGSAPAPATTAGLQPAVGSPAAAGPTAVTAHSGRAPSGSAHVGSSLRTPLTIGMVYTTNQAQIAADFGASSTGATSQSIAQALVKGINATGGLAGRRLIAISYGQNPEATSYASDASAACAKFTQDNHVPVVLDFAFGAMGGFEQCLQQAGVEDITIQYETDRISAERSTLVVNTALMNMDRNYAAVLTRLTATGYLSATNQLGVLIEGCASNLAAYRNTVVPVARQLGLKAPKESVVDCVGGYSGIGGAASQISNAVLAFRTAHVDRVMMMSANEEVALLLFANNAESQGYRPGYALSSNAQAALIQGNLPPGQQPQLRGVGILPGNDVSAPPGPPTAAEARCTKLAALGDVRPSSWGDTALIYGQCAPFLLLETALKATGGVSTPALLTNAINGVGSSFVDPGIVADAARLSSTKHDAPDSVRLFSYIAACSCLRYTSPPMPAPS